MTRIAVVVFPGTNCMYETRDALLAAGADVAFLSWKSKQQDCSSQRKLEGGFWVKISLQNQGYRLLILQVVPVITM